MHAQALITDLYRESWFTVDGIQRLSTFKAGTQAVTSLADLIFIVAIAVVIKRLDRRLAATVS